MDVPYGPVGVPAEGNKGCSCIFCGGNGKGSSALKVQASDLEERNFGGGGMKLWG